MIKDAGQQTILYFFTQQGCAHCMLQRPVVDQFRQTYFGRVMVLELDAEKHDGINDWSPKATPAFAVKSSGVLLGTHEGQLKLAEIERFIERAVSGRGDINENAGSGRGPARRWKRRDNAADGASGDQTEGGESEPSTGADAE